MKALLSKTRKAYAKRNAPPHKQRALTKEPLEAVLETCDDSLKGKRDRALLGALEAANLPSVWLVTSGLDVAMDEGVGFLAEQTAANDGRTISELEDLESLIRAFDGVPLADFEHVIRARLKRTPQEKAKLEKFYRSWRAHNVPGMTALMRADIRPSVRKAMFDIRNANWAPTIAAAARAPKKTLFLVGAGHLCGEGNVLELLARDFGLEARRFRFRDLDLRARPRGHSMPLKFVERG